MLGLRGGFVAVTAMALAACGVPVVPPGGGGGGGPVEPPPITVSEITAEGETIADAYMVNERGQVAVRLPGVAIPTEPNGLWWRGTLTPVTPFPIPSLPVGSLTLVAIRALSDSGQAVGAHVVVFPPPLPVPPIFVPVSWSHGELTGLQAEEGTRAGTALDVNSQGQVVGVVSPGTQAVMWEEGRFVRLGLSTEATASIDINDRGQIALSPLVEVDGALRSHAAVRQADGQVVDLGTLGGPTSRVVAISERGHVVGVSETADGTEHAFLWRGGEMIDLGTLGGQTSRAVAVNDHGHVVGVAETADGVEHAFLWRGGEMIDLSGLPGFERSAAVDINDHDQVVGTSFPAQSDEAHAFLWQDGQVTNLGELVAAGAPSEARDINDHGQIVGLANWVQDGAERDGGQPVMWTAPPNRSSDR